MLGAESVGPGARTRLDAQIRLARARPDATMTVEEAMSAQESPPPPTTGAAVPFGQQRLRLLADALATLLGAAWVVNAALNFAFYSGFEAGRPASVRSVTHAALALGWWLLGLGLRRGRWAQRWVARAEAVAFLATACGFAVMVLLGRPALRPEMVMSMAMGHCLVLRAAVMPSTVTRSGWLGALAEAPILCAAFWLHRSAPRVEGLPAASSIAATLVVWALITIATTLVITGVIYGLRKHLREVARFGQYTLESKVGQGGMGAVYRARHALLRRPTAIKLIATDRATEEQCMRFEREVQSTAKLNHPNIVSIYDYGRSAGGVLYYAMEYVPGVDLQRLVAADGPQPEGRVLKLLLQAAEALLEAHDAGLVHRDIKPSNLLVCPRPRQGEQLKIVDFGLVRDIGWSDATHSDVMSAKGTPLYMAPEAIADPTSVDGRTDLYSLGAVGYFLLTGAPVFGGGSPFDICARHLHEAAQPPSVRLGKAVSPQLESALLGCLEKAPAERPQSAAELIAWLTLADASCEPYTAEATADWWREHGLSFRRATSTQGERSPTARRLEIDPGGRS